MATRLWSDLEHRDYGGVQLLQEMAKRGARPARAGRLHQRARTEHVGAGMPSKASGMGQATSLYSVSQTPQVWLDHQVYEQGGSAVSESGTRSRSCFPAGLLDDMFEAYCGYVRRLAQDDDRVERDQRQPGSAGAIARRAAMNDTAAPVPAGLLHAPFLEQVRVRPHQTAVVTADPSPQLPGCASSAPSGWRGGCAGWVPRRTTWWRSSWRRAGSRWSPCSPSWRRAAPTCAVDPDLPQERRWLLLQRGEVEHRADAVRPRGSGSSGRRTSVLVGGPRAGRTR